MGPLVLSLCDRTTTTVRPWADAGYECWCVDLRHPPGIGDLTDNVRLVGADVLTFLPPRASYAFVAAAPPCTDLAVSGARHFKDKGLAALASSLAIVNRCREIAEWAGAPFFIENPVSVLSSFWRKPDHILDPCDYAGYADDPQAEAYTKRTCLWAGGGFIMPTPRPVPPVKVCPQGSWVQRLGGKSQRTKDARSVTPSGFARAVYLANAAGADHAATNYIQA